MTARLFLPKHVLKVCIACFPCISVTENRTTSKEFFVETNPHFTTIQQNLLPLEQFLQIYPYSTIAYPETCKLLHFESNGSDRKDQCKIMKIKEDEIFPICNVSALKILSLSPVIQRNSALSCVTTKVELFQEHCGCIFIICCVSTFTDAVKILTKTKSSLKVKPSLLTFLLSKKSDAVRDEEFIYLRKYLKDLFSIDGIPAIVIICETKTDFKRPFSKEPQAARSEHFNSLIEQCFYTHIFQALQTQIFFL